MVIITIACTTGNITKCTKPPRAPRLARRAKAGQRRREREGEPAGTGAAAKGRAGETFSGLARHTPSAAMHPARWATSFPLRSSGQGTPFRRSTQPHTYRETAGVGSGIGAPPPPRSPRRPIGDWSVRRTPPPWAPEVSGGRRLYINKFGIIYLLFKVYPRKGGCQADRAVPPPPRKGISYNGGKPFHDLIV